MYNEKRYKSGVKRIVILLKGMIIGAVSALGIAAIASLFGEGAPWTVQFPSTMKILLPSGAVFGFCLAINRHAQYVDIIDRIRTLLFAKDAPLISIRVLVMGLLGLGLIRLLYGSCRLFATSFHHQGLAALAFLLFLMVSSAFVLLLAPFVLRIVSAWVQRSVLLSRVFGRPVVSLFFVTGLGVGAVAPPLLIGPGATGLFGFLGLLRINGAKEALCLLLMMIASVLLFGGMQKKSKKEDIRPPI